MAITREVVRSIFSNLADDGGRFFDHVAEDVDCTVKGTHPARVNSAGMPGQESGSLWSEAWT
jgi:hypothetical protein